MPINSNNLHQLGVAQIACAVIHAGECILLALEHRVGRHPVQLLSAGFKIRWLCADGQIEFVDLSAHQEEHERLVQEMARGGLLVAELGDITPGPVDGASHWLLQTPGAPLREACG